METRHEDLMQVALAQEIFVREAVRLVTAEMLGEAGSKVVHKSQEGAMGQPLLLCSNEAKLEQVGYLPLVRWICWQVVLLWSLGA